MACKTTAITGTDGDLDQFPEFPPRDDMRNWQFLYRNAQAAALATGLRPTVTVRPRHAGTQRWKTAGSGSDLRHSATSINAGDLSRLIRITPEYLYYEPRCLDRSDSDILVGVNIRTT